MKTMKVTLTALVLLTIGPSLLAADFGVRAGRYNDSDEEFVGAEVLFDLGALNLNPNLEYQLSDDDGTAGSVNLDLLFQIAPGSAVNPFIGAGVGLRYVDHDLGDNRTDLVGNLIGGVSFPLGVITPYAQVKYFRLLENEDGGDAEDDIALTVGLRF